MNTRLLSILLVAGLSLSVNNCSRPCRPMSFTELLGLEIFPEEVGGVWERDGSPGSAFAPRGYIHAVYDKKDEFCLFKVWVIDKCNPANAEDWLTKLRSGEHTAESVAPFPPDIAESREYYAGFSEAPASIRNMPLYERIQSDDSGYILYGVYFTSGRYVVGGENTLCGLRDVRTARRDFVPILENLSLEVR